MASEEKEQYRQKSFQQLFNKFDEDFKQQFYNEFDIEQELNSILDNLQIKHYL